jgi:hypothetical protein
MSYSLDDAMADHFIALREADLWEHNLGFSRDALIHEMGRRETYPETYCQHLVTAGYRCLRLLEEDTGACPVHGTSTHREEPG